MQLHQVHMNHQLKRLDELESLVQKIVSEMNCLRSDILNPKVNETTEPHYESYRREFIEPILKLIAGPIGTEPPVGQAAVISKVQAIRRILTNDQELEVFKSPYEKVRNNKVERLENDTPTGEVEDIFLQCYLTFSRNRYHFVEKSQVVDIFCKLPEERNKWEIFVSSICLANGCRVAELSKLAMQPSPKYYFDKAIDQLCQIPILTLQQQIQTCMLLALYLHYIYDYHDNFVMNVWELSRIAITKMSALGYQRKKIPTIETCLEVEIEKRIFWSVYAFDRLLSISLGRPSYTADIQIDINFPLSLETVGEHNRTTIFELQMKQFNEQRFKEPVTSITYLVETCKIREIESRINNLAYGRDSNKYEFEFDAINEALEDWIANIPNKKEFNEGLRREVSFEYMLLLYHRAKLFLLLPKITTIQENSPSKRQKILHQTLHAAGGMCQCFKKIHKDSLFGYSTFSLHTIFLAGVTLVYCVWALGNPPTIKAHNDIRACSNLLYSFSERTSEAETYRMLFENLVEKVLYNSDITVDDDTTNESVSNGNHYSSLLANEGLFDDNIMFNFKFEDDFWKRLDFSYSQ